VWSSVVTVVVSLVALAIVILLVIEFAPKMSRPKTRVRLGSSADKNSETASALRRN